MAKNSPTVSRIVNQVMDSRVMSAYTLDHLDSMLLKQQHDPYVEIINMCQDMGIDVRVRAMLNIKLVEWRMELANQSQQRSDYHSVEILDRIKDNMAALEAEYKHDY